MLGMLVNLRELDLSANRVSDLGGLAPLGQLEHLYLADNRLQDISTLAQLANLREIDLANNQVRSIDSLSQLENVWRLVLDGNPIDDISPLLNFGELELISLREIDNLPCDTVQQLVEEVGTSAVITDETCQ
jgi:Leucine-rich repeat (LRR) protein